MSQPTQIIMIDNFDSFTYNLVDQFRQLDIKVVIFRNDAPIEQVFSTERLKGKNNIIVLSPGPGNPDSAGNTLEIISRFSGEIPILGICLGHQSIVQHFGGQIKHAKEVVHGKADSVISCRHEVFKSLTTPFRAARYHSLVATNIPDSLKVIAETESENNREVMAVVHRKLKVLGLQFHPESILTTYGKLLLNDAINWLLEAENSYSANVA